MTEKEQEHRTASILGLDYKITNSLDTCLTELVDLV